ncbi:hypothetical protein HAX54_027520, partial [Datura stramonium]|nr:hypothetical protein [Datura stramonium]
ALEYKNALNDFLTEAPLFKYYESYSFKLQLVYPRCRPTLAAPLSDILFHGHLATTHVPTMGHTSTSYDQALGNPKIMLQFLDHESYLRTMSRTENYHSLFPTNSSSTITHIIHLRTTHKCNTNPTTVMLHRPMSHTLAHRVCTAIQNPPRLASYGPLPARQSLGDIFSNFFMFMGHISNLGI